MNFIIHKTVIFLLLLSYLPFSSAKEVTYIGAIPCGKWSKYRQKNDLGNMVAQGNMVGYLSGLAVGANSDYLNNADLGSLLLWVDKYCQNSPLKNTYQAGDDLFRELKKD